MYCGKVHTVHNTFGNIFSTDRIDGNLRWGHFHNWPAAHKALGIEHETLVKSLLFYLCDLLIATGEYLSRCVPIQAAVVMLNVSPVIVITTPLSGVFGAVEFAGVLFRTLFQQVFPNSKHTACRLIYRFDTDIGFKWKDSHGRRFLATVGQPAWSTNTG